MRLCRVCRAFVSPLQGDGRAGVPFTQGGARRLRRLALPWANLFCPFGAWVVFDAGRFRRGWSAPLAPSPRNPIVLTLRRGNDKIAQGRASRRSRDAPPWVARPTPRSIAPKGHDKTAIQTCSRSFANGCNWMASIHGPRRAKNEWQRIGHHPSDSGV
jgi:hypothetical protein